MRYFRRKRKKTILTNPKHQNLYQRIVMMEMGFFPSFKSMRVYGILQYYSQIKDQEWEAKKNLPFVSCRSRQSERYSFFVVNHNIFISTTFRVDVFERTTSLSLTDQLKWINFFLWFCFLEPFLWPNVPLLSLRLFTNSLSIFHSLIVCTISFLLMVYSHNQLKKISVYETTHFYFPQKTKKTISPFSQ